MYFSCLLVLLAKKETFQTFSSGHLTIFTANEWQQIYKDIYLVERIYRGGRGAKLFVKLTLMSKYKFSKKKGKFEASSFTWPQAFAEVVEWAEGAAEAAADDRAQDADDL